jgi:colanic acid/amylovoran biosynthesis protein
VVRPGDARLELRLPAHPEGRSATSVEDPALIVEVLGIFERNKGALLMLEAIRERLAEDFPDAVYAVPASTPAESRARLGVLGVIRKGRLKTRLASALPASLLRSRGLVRQADVDVILDASGFGYGDVWGPGKLRDRLVDTVAAWKGPGKAAILLPQAMGPFEAPGMRQALQAAVGGLDLLFVRDEVSLAYLKAAGVDDARVVLAPDFTNGLKARLKPEHSHLAGLSLVIPNEKMVAGDRAPARGDYVRFLATAVRALAAGGRPVSLLVHEGAPDRVLAAEANALLDTPVEVVDLPSPVDTKAVIAAAEMIVTSRFHGLVSALSSGVPALACGWSHKYQALLDDYGVPEFSVSVGVEADWAAKLDALVAAAGSPGFRASLKAAAEVQKERTRQMWARTIETLREIRAPLSP